MARELLDRLEDTELRLRGAAGMLTVLSMDGELPDYVARACALLYRTCEDAAEAVGDATEVLMRTDAEH